ncbi:MAG TPA: PilZ domain-containing protein [Planctomycetota bacterium]|nr:PilZ domain-containing protein [Planctomycetota bacterium]
MADKRQNPRYRSLNFAAKDGVLFRTLDISIEGMLLEMEKPPQLGTRVTLTVAFGEKVVTVSGEVVRHVTRVKGKTGVGVRFDTLEPKAKWALEEHLIERKMKGATA